MIEYKNSTTRLMPRLSAKAAANPRSTRHGRNHLRVGERHITFLTVDKIFHGVALTDIMFLLSVCGFVFYLIRKYLAFQPENNSVRLGRCRHALRVFSSQIDAS